MPIQEKRRYLKWFFCASFGFAVIILLVGFIGYLTVRELSKESVRDKEFDALLTQVRQSYESAFSLAQRKMLGEVFNGEIGAERRKTLQLTEQLQAVVGNNFNQNETLTNLHRLFDKRFSTQDIQYQTMKRMPTGELVYDEQIIKQSIETSNLINETFVRLRQNSTDMFREKHAKIVNWQYWLTMFTLGDVVLLLISLIVFYYYNIKQLDKAEKAGNKMDEMAKETTTDIIIISKTRAAEFAAFLREETSEL